MRGQRQEPKHVKRINTRKAERKEERKRKVREWAATRPKQTDADMTVIDQAAKLLDGGSAWDQANTTGLCQSTIYRFRNGKVFEPRFRTLQMIAKAHGGRMVFVKDN